MSSAKLDPSRVVQPRPTVGQKGSRDDASKPSSPVPTRCPGAASFTARATSSTQARSAAPLASRPRPRGSFSELPGEHRRVLAVTDPVDRVRPREQSPDVRDVVIDHRAVGEEARVAFRRVREPRPRDVLARAAIRVPVVPERQDQLHPPRAGAGQHPVSPTSEVSS